MEIVVILIALAVVVIIGTAISERIGVAAPMLLIAVGVLGSFLPFIPQIHLEPEVVLLGLLPPLLYATAIQTSIVDVRANLGTVLQLSVVLVVVTTFAVAAVVMAMMPSVGWPLAIAIGAVVAPPDAVAASAVARRIGLPRSVTTILEAESLLNDATALVAVRTALAAIAVSVSIGQIGWDFLVAAGGGVLVGLLVFFVVAQVRHRLTDALLDTAISFVIPFAAYILAEEIHASGVIAVVVAGILLGHKAPIVQTASSRVTEQITWRTIAFLLENAVFLLIGLQARTIITDLGHSGMTWGRAIAICLATLATVIVVRLVYVLLTGWLRNLRRKRADQLSTNEQVLIGWAGMRGVVTLAAAFIIPANVPHRELMLLIALTVVIGTLFIQGLTLPVLTRLVKVSPPDPASDALARATLLQQAGEAGLARLDELDYDDHSGVAEMIRRRVDQRSFAEWERLSTTSDAETPSEQYARLRAQMLEAERARVLQIRSEGKVPSDVVREVLGMLDIEESMIEVGSQARETIQRGTLGSEGGDCVDLLEFGPIQTVADPVCQDCIREGTHPVALRQCLVCGNVGCCDSSVGHHATAHFHATGHPVMESAEPGENWRWCYVHSTTA